MGLVGRDTEHLAAREQLASGARLLTLWGPPGIGKTRFAQALAAEVTPAPVWVALAGTHDVEGFLAAVAGAAGETGEPQLATLTHRWLVLDNLEHLLDNDAEAVTSHIARWLAQVEGLTILATSRGRLRLLEEHAILLRPLAPETGLDLFLSHVRRQHGAFEPDLEERETLLELMRTLDGLPLAIELAAARWELLGTQGLLHKLSQPLSVLARPGAAEARHATLREAIRWSWDLLSADERRALRAVATFAGSFTWTDAEALCGSALDLLEGLRDAALLQIPVAGRFELLGSVRAYARDQTESEEQEQLRAAHAEWCLARHPDPERRMASAAERDDLVAACEHWVEQRDPRAGLLLVALGASAPGQHLKLLDQAVERVSSIWVLRARSRALRVRGRLEEAVRDLEAALELADGPAERGPMQRQLGVIHHTRGDLDEARACYEKALECARAVGDRHAEAVTIGNLGAVDHDLCRFEDAEARYAEALTGLRAVGDQRVEATFLANQAVLWQEQGLLPQAERAYRRALDLLERVGDHHAQAITLGNLGLLLHELGQIEEARQLHEQGLQQLADIPDPKSEALSLARLAAAQAQLGNAVEARRRHTAAERAAARSGDGVVRQVVTLFEAFLDLVEGDAQRVAARLQAASTPSEGRPAPIELSGDARVAVRLLRSAVPDERAAIEVGSDWFVPPGGKRADLSRHASVRRMFGALVEQREARPEDALDVEALFAAGWPGERIAVESMRNRVHVNLAKLRSLGLKGLLMRADDGYRLDPEVSIRRAV